jgi:carbonic anhydrase
VNLEPGNAIDVGGVEYGLAQFHFHAPSEHELDGRHTALEVHFVHKTSDGKLGVVGILVDELGAENTALAPIFKAMDKPGDVDVDLADILPRKHAYYTYEGSLTTPPCSEGVHWMVLQERLHTSKSNVKRFTKLFPRNARPAQAINDRTVEAAGD